MTNVEDVNTGNGDEEITDMAKADAKKTEEGAQIQALVDKKKVIIIDASMRRDLRFEDEGVVDCLSNEVIFEQTNTHRVLDLEEAKTAQEKEIASLKKRVKKLKQKRKSVTSGLKRLRKVGTASRVESLTEASLGDQEDASKQGRMIDNINQDLEITLVDDTQGRMNEEEMFGVNDVDGDDMVVDVSASEKVEQSVKVVKKEVGTADPITTVGEVVTTAATIVTATGTRPKGKGIVMQEPSETPSPKPIDSSQKPSQAKDKGKGKMVEPERPLKRKD
uniref:Uncharacterized protein n=1 Tax=Tanacetum cinerariifolium TaxID=118510 RepID=A0A699I303_TANCI|nr:hypothetical protein [Tanacetum cinerariifolium]